VCELKDEVLILQRPTEQPAYMRNTKKNAFLICPEKKKYYKYESYQ